MASAATGKNSLVNTLNNLGDERRDSHNNYYKSSEVEKQRTSS